MAYHYTQRKAQCPYHSLGQHPTTSGSWPPAQVYLRPLCTVHLTHRLLGLKHTHGLCSCFSLCLQYSSYKEPRNSLLPFLQVYSQMVPNIWGGL